MFVQPLSEYTVRFGEVVIVPVEVKFWLTVMAAKVEPASAKAAIVRAIIKIFEVLSVAMCVAPLLQELIIET